MMAKQHGTNDDYRAAFDAIDTNKDGYISVEDLMKMFANIGMSLSEEQIKHLIEAGDRNGNGAIDYEEFVAMMKSSQKSR
jgi:Ca2+-binding EF-hand superfamily protein